MTKHMPNLWLNLRLDLRDMIALLAALAVLVGLPPAVPVALTALYGALLVRPGLALLRRCWAAAGRARRRLLARRARRGWKARPERTSRHTRT